MFELPKLVFIILIAGVVWYVMRWFKGSPNELPRRRSPPPPRNHAPRATEDLVPCGVCGAYVAADAPSCGRPDCPRAR